MKAITVFLLLFSLCASSSEHIKSGDDERKMDQRIKRVINFISDTRSMVRKEVVKAIDKKTTRGDSTKDEPKK
jgi:hypothetical protein